MSQKANISERDLLILRAEHNVYKKQADELTQAKIYLENNVNLLQQQLDNIQEQINDLAQENQDLQQDNQRLQNIINTTPNQQNLEQRIQTLERIIINWTQTAYFLSQRAVNCQNHNNSRYYYD